MNPCPQCGAVPQASDKFCNICGTPVGAPPAHADPRQAQGGYAQPPQGFGASPAPAYGAPPAPLRCQMGHDIAPGASYCAHGHPLALEAMPFANDQYGGGHPQGAPAPGFGAPQQGYGAPAQGYGAPQQGYGAPAPGGFAPPGYPDPAAQGYGAQPYQDPNAQAYAQPQGGFPPQPGYGGGFDPQQGYAQQGYGQQPGYGAPAAPPAQGFGAPPAPYGAPAPQPGYGAPAPGAAPAAAPSTTVPPTALRGFLVSYQANAQGEFWPLSGGRKTIGRHNSGEQVDIPLADATISSKHAAIVVDGVLGTVVVEDTGSTNGTFVNEEHIGSNGKRELRDGDRVRFGGFTTIVKVVTRI